jgi:hypothetical protein
MPSLATIKKCVEWLDASFRTKIERAFKGTPFGLEHIYAIAWQESSELWPDLVGKYDTAQILGFCVLDGSGDVPKKPPRKQYPQKKAVLEKDDPELTSLLLAEGNKARVARGMKPSERILYKGYGIFQYDLWYVKEDRSFFAERKWYDFDECLKKLKGELMTKYSATRNVRRAIRAYNGRGADAESYVKKVFAFIEQMKDLGLPS